MPDPEVLYSAAPVAYFFWIFEEDRVGCERAQKITESFDLLDDAGEVANGTPSKASRGEGRGLGRYKFAGVSAGQERQAWVPVIDEFGRIAATILPRIDIEEAWSQLANFPMPPDEEDLLADGDTESTGRCCPAERRSIHYGQLPGTPNDATRREHRGQANVGF